MSIVRKLVRCIFIFSSSPKDVPRVLTVLNTTKAERNTQQNNKDNQGLFAATLSFMLSQSSGNIFSSSQCSSRYIFIIVMSLSVTTFSGICS